MSLDCDDVFAGLTNFCENFSTDNIVPVRQPPAVTGQTENADNSADSDAENFFRKISKSGRSAKSRARKPVAKVSESSPLKRGKRGKNAPAAETVTETVENVADNITQQPEPARRRARRSARQAESIESYLLARTEELLGIQNAAVPPQTNRPRRCRASRSNASNERVIGTINLAGSKTPPLPPRSDARKPETITIDSDDECNFTFSESFTNGDISFDVENAVIDVKVNWDNKIEVMPHRKHQKFEDLMKIFADRENAEIKDILLDLNDRIIEPGDTPDSIGYSIAQFISGRVVRNGINYIKPKKKKDPNIIKVKIQSNAFKKRLEVQMRRDQQFRILYVKCAEELSIPCQQIKLSFDGDALSLTETPIDLEFDGGEVVDCRID